MRYTKNYKTHIVATGIIDTPIIMNKDPYEDNLKPLLPEHGNDFFYIFSETCQKLGVDQKKFMRTFKKIAKEIIE